MPSRFEFSLADWLGWTARRHTARVASFAKAGR